jgi:UDP-4-amino-4,6-dideoxy-N-acetyl-beta-L-altrosamine N-acetyltransferase
MQIKLVNLKDADYKLQLEVRNWRNSEHVAKYFQIPNIDEETHKNWLKSLNEEKPKNIAFLIEVDGKFVGLAYFLKIDYEIKQADWGMYIYNQDLRGRGIGATVIQKCIDFARRYDLIKIKLEVLNTNLGAIKLYEKSGFVFTKEKDDKILFYEFDSSSDKI